MSNVKRSLLNLKKVMKHQTLGQSQEQKEPLLDNLIDNENKLRLIYKDCSDVIFRHFYIGEKVKAILIYIEGLSNTEEIDDNVLFPLMNNPDDENCQVDVLIEKKISVSNVKEIKTFYDCIQEISSGNPVIIINEIKTGFSLGLSKWEKRSIEEPSAESVVRGPREGFVETLLVNTSVKIRTPQLKFKSMEIGQSTKTKVVIAYIEGIADRALVEEVTERLSRIEIDGILDWIAE